MSNSPLVVYTRLSPNCNKPRNHKIDTITIHCAVTQCTAERLGEIFAPVARQASSNYGVDKDGRIGMYCEEKNRSWCTSSGANDHRAITIEVASDTKAPYRVTDKALASLIDLCTDICKRNGIKALLWKGDKSLIGHVEKQNMTVHRWFANKACPGEYLYNLHGHIADEVNKRLNPAAPPSRGGDRPTNPIATISPTVRMGSHGSAVIQVQMRLNKYGFGLVVDGDFGPKTDAAVREFQKEHGLVVDGICGPKTWAVLLK